MTNTGGLNEIKIEILAQCLVHSKENSIQVFLKYLWSMRSKDTRLGWGEGQREPRTLPGYTEKRLGMLLDESGKACGGGRILVGVMMVGVFGR